MKRTRQPKSEFANLAGAFVRRDAVLWAHIQPGKGGGGHLLIQLAGAPAPLEIPYYCADSRKDAEAAMVELVGIEQPKVKYETDDRK